MPEEEDCNCGFETPKPELVCRLELDDAMNFEEKLQRKKGELTNLQKTAKRSNNEQKKKEIVLQSIHLQREINQLEEAKLLAFQRFSKCESQNPQVQSLDITMAEKQLKATWDSILDSNSNIIPSTNGNTKQKTRKKRKKAR